MTDHASERALTIEEIQAELHDLAQRLREARHLGAESQRTLADLLDELRCELDPAPAQSAHAAHVAELVAHLARALHKEQDRGAIPAVRKKLEEAIGRAEAEAPVAVGVVRRFVDALANMGI